MSKVTIITGGTSGIGRGIAEKILANSGADDILYVSFGHNQKQAEEFLHAQSEADQKKLRLIQADMSSYDQMMNFVTRIKKETDHVDWLVNNVGISTYAKYEDYTFEEWSKIVNTNLSVPVFLVKELRPIIREGGSILFTGSYAGQQAYSSSLVYGVTKSAIHFLTKSLVKELEPKQIRVNAIAPGFFVTKQNRKLLFNDDGTPTPRTGKILAATPMGRFGEASELSGAVLFLLNNDAASFITGVVLPIDGGFSAYSGV